MSQENVGVKNAVVRRLFWAFENDAAAFREGLHPVVEEGDKVVVSVHITARGKTSGALVDVCFYTHIKLRDDKVVYIFDYADRAEALEAAGLRE